MNKPLVSTRGHNHYVLILLTLTAAINFLDRQILGVLLEPIGQEFELSDSLLGLLSGLGFAAFYSILGIPIAVMADRFSRRNIIVAAITVFSAMTALCGAATSFMQLFFARIGVGVGEAGTLPASHSIISDLFNVNERPTAMGLLASGGNLGLMLGLLIGGWVNEWYGWRAAFLVAAVPGLVLAVTIWFTVEEPVRSERAKRSNWLQDVVEGFVMLVRVDSFRRLALANSLFGVAGYGILTWLPVYFIRYHDMSTGEIGTVMSLVIGVLGGLGAFGAGALCAWLNPRDIRWNCWVPALGMAITVPMYCAMLTTDHTQLALLLFVIPGFLISANAGPTWSIVQELVPVNKRAVAASIFLMIFNLVGLGLGPLSVGLLSDMYKPNLGEESLRWAMITSLLLGVVGIMFYLRAAGSIAADIRGPQQQQGLREPAAVKKLPSD